MSITPDELKKMKDFLDDLALEQTEGPDSFIRIERKSNSNPKTPFDGEIVPQKPASAAICERIEKEIAKIKKDRPDDDTIKIASEAIEHALSGDIME